MILTTPGLAAAIEAPERVPLVRMTADWVPGATNVALRDLSPYIESVIIDRAAAGDLPDEVSLVEGAAAASAEITLAAPGQNLAAVFNRANPASPLHDFELLSAPITIDLGFQTANGPEFVRRFTGVTRAVRGANRSVRLTALDLKEHLGWPVNVPVVGRLHYGLTASWVLSHVVSAGGGPQRAWVVSPATDFYTWQVNYHGSLYPPSGADPRYTARMVGSAVYPSTTGTTSADVTAEPAFVPGPYLTGAYAGATPRGRTGTVVRGEFTYDYSPSYHEYSNARVEFWTIRRPPLAADPVGAWRVAFVFNESATNALMAGVNGSGSLVLAKHTGDPDAPAVLATGQTVPADGQWHYVRIEWRSSGPGPATVTAQLDAATQTATVSGFPAPFPYQVAVTRGYFRQPLAELFITASVHQNEPEVLWDLRGTVNAVIDPSTLELDLVPDLGYRPAWVWLRELAAAEQAVVHIDEDGILRYRTATRLATPAAQTPARTVTAENSVIDLALDDAIDAVKTEVSVTATVRAVAATVTPVYTSSAVYVLQPSEVWHLYAELNSEAIEIDTIVTVNRPTDPSPDPSTTHVCLSFNANGTGTGNPDDEAMLGWQQPTVSYMDGRVYDLRLQNNTGRPLYIATSKPVVHGVSLAGRAVAKTPVTITRVPRYEAGTHPVLRRHGVLPLTLAANPWVQRVQVAESLAYRLLFDLYRPIAVVRDLSIVADPRLQLGDRVRIQDAEGLALDGDYWISAIRDQYSASRGYRQAITARRASTILRWGTGRWGENTWGVST